jgi:ABC-type amino acid transport system permease subunit
MQELSEVFLSLLLTSCIGLILAVCKLAYKSKCSNIEICCIKITRNIPAEIELDEREPPSPRPQDNSQRV